MSYYKRKRDLEKTRIQRFILAYAKKLRIIKEHGGCCKMCGYDNLENFCVFQFHHIDAGKKIKGVCALLGGSYQEVKKEAKKCILVCENCHKIITGGKKYTDRKRINKTEFLKYKGTLCCVKCGYDKNYIALDFHHIKDKQVEISTLLQGSLEKAKKELDKCVVLCSNCHRIEHFNRELYNKCKNQIRLKRLNLKDTYKKIINHAKILELNKNGFSQSKIGKISGCSVSSVCEILKLNGIHTYLVRPALNIKMILKLRKQGKTNPEIAKILGCHRFSIPNAIRALRNKVSYK